MDDDSNPYQSAPDQSYLGDNPDETSMNGDSRPVIPFESGHTRAVWTMRLIGFILVLSVISVAANFYEIDLLSHANSGSDWAAKADINDACQMALGLIELVTYLASAILFIMWFHRVHRNLPALGAMHLKYSPGWTMGSWFVPIMNLFRPYQVMVEVWHGSLPEQNSNKTFVDHIDRGSHALVGWWWAAYIIMGIFDQISTRITMAADTVQSLIVADWAIIIASTITIPAALLAISLVKKIDRNQELHYKELLNMSEDDRQEQPWV